MIAKVKICGLTQSQDVEAAIRYGADYLGFIVEAKSARRLSVREAARLSLPAKGIIPRVAVTVNAGAALISNIVSQMQPDFIQFHGDETPQYVAEVGRDHNVGIIKAVSLSSQTDILAALDYVGFADFILFDAKGPKGGARGGHGVSFDWKLLKNAALPQNWFLAGGLNPDNVTKALRLTAAPILDVSSGVETKSGIKSTHKIAKFMTRL